MKTTEYHAAVARNMAEADLSERVRTACKTMGLRAYHTHNSKFSASGYPDWHILGPHGSLYRELKTEKGRLSVEQALWLEGLTRAGYDAACWRPADWMSGRIVRELQELAISFPDGPGRTNRARLGTAHGSAAVLDSREGPDFDASADNGPSRSAGGAP